MKVMAIDPGGTTGFALFNGELIPEAVGEVKQDDLFDWLSSYKDVDIWVVEDYFVRPGKGKNGYQHQWNRGDTFRIIGAIHFHAFLTRSEFQLQQPSQKVMGYKLMGKEYVKGKKDMHMFDAIAHGHVYLSKNPRLLKS